MATATSPALKTLLVLVFIFVGLGVSLFFVGIAFFDSREFTISLLTSTIAVCWGAALAVTILILDKYQEDRHNG